MLRRFWVWLWGPSPLMIELAKMGEQQERLTQTVMHTVQQLGAASEKQAEVLGMYLKLFQTPGDPQRWEHDEQGENSRVLAAKGFPAGDDEAAQAQWVLDHMHEWA